MITIGAEKLKILIQRVTRPPFSPLAVRTLENGSVFQERDIATTFD
jgi:hypothetical protein